VLYPYINVPKLPGEALQMPERGGRIRKFEPRWPLHRKLFHYRVQIRSDIEIRFAAKKAIFKKENIGMCSVSFGHNKTRGR